MSAPRFAAPFAVHGPADPVVWGARPVLAREAWGHVRALAERLPDGDAGDEVLVVCHDRYRFTVACTAAWLRGFAVALPPHAEVHAVRALRDRALTVVHDMDGVGRGVDVRALHLAGAVDAPPIEAIDGARHLATVYTSGSTGQPQPVPKDARHLLGETETLRRTFGVGPGARVLAMVPSHHIYGLLFGVLLPATGGGALCRGTPLHAETVAKLAAGADVLVSVPAHLRGLLVAEAMPAVDRVFSSSAPLPPQVAAALTERFGWRITEIFGSSETGGIGWRQSGGRGPWRPLDGVAVGADAEGRMLVDSPWLGPPRPYRAADRVELLEDGTFLHRGRSDGIAKIGGVRVSVQEVEARIAALDVVEEVAVLAVEVDGARGIELHVAAVAPGRDSVALRRLVREALKGWLPPVALPRRVRAVDRLPRNAQGKVPREALRALFAGRKR
jgi:4-coumarate--CoA ligase (photoactive yellow protein activation family)